MKKLLQFAFLLSGTRNKTLAAAASIAWAAIVADEGTLLLEASSASNCDHPINDRNADLRECDRCRIVGICAPLTRTPQKTSKRVQNLNAN